MFLYDNTKKEIVSLSAGKSVDTTDIKQGHNIVNYNLGVPKTRGRGAGSGCGVRGAGCGVRGAGCGVRGAGCGVRGAGSTKTEK